LIPTLADKYYVVALDFPGYGESSAPSVGDLGYSFERLASVTEKFTEKLNLSSYALYLSDIGAFMSSLRSKGLEAAGIPDAIHRP
jgi:pimeloyl-ACP methyl ester carboxylesterase